MKRLTLLRQARSTYVIDWPARHPIEDTWQALTWRDRGLRKPEVCSLLRTSVRLFSPTTPF